MEPAPTGGYEWMIHDTGAASDEEQLRWTLDVFADLPPPSGVDEDEDGETGCCLDQTTSKKRSGSGSAVGSRPKTNACLQKTRRERLNDRFLELSAVLNPGRPPKSDKAGILRDAARALLQLKGEAQERSDANQRLRNTIRDLKAEKDELRDEKITLKTEIGWSNRSKL